MARFIVLIQFTEQGARNVKDTVKRAETFAQGAKDIGIHVREVYWTLGDKDGVLIFDAADDATAVRGLVHLAAQANVRTSTLRAFTKDEMVGIVTAGR